MLSLINWAMLVAAMGVASANDGTMAEQENWSRFRGPNGCGVAEGVHFPATWSDKDYAWKVKLPGKGHSSPVAWGGRTFVTSGNEETGEITLSAISAKTGESEWTKKFKSAPHHLHNSNSYASSSPAADAKRVYVTWATPDKLAIAAITHDGRDAWQRELGLLKYAHGCGGSPIVLDDMVVVANDNSGESYVTALDAATGEPRWRQSRKAGTESYATPVIWRAEDGSSQIIVNSTAEGMAALSPSDGRPLWQLAKIFPVRCVCSPVVADGLVFAGSGEGGNGKTFAVVKPATNEGGEPKITYELKKGIPQVPTAVAHDGLLFVWNDRGVVSCYDLAGGEPHWSERVGGNFFGSPVILGDKLYSIAADGTVVVLAAGREYKLLGRTPLGEASSATPMVQNGKLYLRTETSLACLVSDRVKP
jgi:outer membrane protein assembly factor BamB